MSTTMTVSVKKSDDIIDDADDDPSPSRGEEKKQKNVDYPFSLGGGGGNSLVALFQSAFFSYPLCLLLAV